MIGAPVLAIVPSLSLRYFPCGSWQLLQASCVLGNVPPGAVALTASTTYPLSAAMMLWPWLDPSSVDVAPRMVIVYDFFNQPKSPPGDRCLGGTPAGMSASAVLTW